jgi:RNA polymerase sigma factor (sigma-70 family)
MTPQGAGGLDQAVLLEQVSWIRRLARELVSDRELAEDLVQETCAVALQRAPEEPRKLRQWLAEVLRNALRQHARSQGRRRARESLAARPEGLEPTDVLVERVLLQRELVDAVVALEEPYRTTVLLRFFEELPPREIARRMGAPLATVNSRLQRALARLRERLDERDGASDGARDRAWAVLLLPWVRDLAPFGPPTLLSAAMNTKLLVSAGAAALAAGALLWWSVQPGVGRAKPAPENLALAAPDLPRAERADGAAPAEEPVHEREALPAPGPRAGPEAPVNAALAAWTVRLRVLDAEGLPMSGIEVAGEGSTEVLGTSGSGGWCVFTTRAEQLELGAADPRWVTIHEGSAQRESSLDPVLVLAPAITLAGFVRDEPGRPLSGASVRFELPRGFRTRFTEVLEAGRALGWRASSDAEGRFVFERVPAVAGCTLSAVLAGYEHDEIQAPESAARDLELVLFRPKLPLEGVLRGEVLAPDGARVPGARVGLGLASVVSDEQGRFELALARAVTADQLTAVKAGFLPARLERPGEPGAGRSGWPDHVELVLGGVALSIRGTVLDHEKKPVSGARVWVHDPTPTTPIGRMPGFLEPLMAGAPIPPEVLESEAHMPAEDGDNFYDWYTNVHEPSALWHWATTDGEGRFELGGLDRRRYKLDVLAKGSLQLETSQGFEAGERSAVVRLEPPDVFARVEGRVHSAAGVPVLDVSVSLFRPMIDARARIFGGNSQVVLIEPAGRTTTDATGRFTLENVPRKGARVSLRGDGIVPFSAEITAAELDLPVEVRCHLEVVLRADTATRFDQIQAYDGEGTRLDLMVLTEGSTNAYTGIELVGGRSGVVSVSERARELRFLKDGAVVETRTLDLVPGDVNRIEF